MYKRSNSTRLLKTNISSRSINKAQYDKSKAKFNNIDCSQSDGLNNNHDNPIVNSKNQHVVQTLNQVNHVTTMNDQVNLMSPVTSVFSNKNLKRTGNQQTQNIFSLPNEMSNLSDRMIHNGSNNKLILLNSKNIENKIAGDIISQQNFDKFVKMNKFDMLDSLNKEIDRYNKGIPQLMEKVESTIDKINKVNIFDEKTHPIIKMASKQSGVLVHLHLDELIGLIIDDLLFECVEELEKIEEINNKKEQKRQLKNFVSSYYQNFELLKNLETDISKKLTSKNYGGVKSMQYVNGMQMQIQSNELPYQLLPILSDNVKVENILSSDENFPQDKTTSNIIYTNPFENTTKVLKKDRKVLINPNLLLSEEVFQTYKNTNLKYKSHIPNKLLYNIENYSKNYYDYLRTTGAFYFPNIFVLYDDIVKEIIKDILDDELDYSMKQIDNFVNDLYKDEVLMNKAIK